MTATLYVHPVTAAFCLLCAFYALYLGIRRRLAPASRNRHDSFGSIALGGFIVVGGVGMAQTFQTQHAVMPFAEHGYAAFVFLPFAVFGLVSGHLLAVRKAPRKCAPLHGLVMAAGLIVACWTAYTGLDVLSLLKG